MQTRNIWSQNLFPSLLDYVIMGTYLIVILMIAFYIQQKNIHKNPNYKYFTAGLLAKIGGAIAVGLVYTLYYGIQDTLGFYISSEAMVNLLFDNPKAYFRILMGDISPEALSNFTRATGYPWYRHDPSSFFIVRITSIFTLLGFKNYFTTSILFASFFFIGYWKLFLLLTTIHPRYHKGYAIAVFFLPSVVFWGSGILKDTVTLSMTGWFLYALYSLFYLKKDKLKNTLAIIITGYLILAIKAYIIVALIPGAMIWLGWSYIRKVENVVVRFLFAPVTALFFLIFGFMILNLMSSTLGVYGSIEGIISKAIITYEDHTTTAHYGDNYYTLGEFDGTLGNFLSKAPAAIAAGLFRPFLWEVRNVFMALAALENTALLIMVITMFWRTGIVKTFKIAFDEPLIVFSIVFAIVFAFAVGVSTANFGALVRLKIPLLPLFVAGLITLYQKSREEKFEAEKETETKTIPAIFRI